MHQHNQHHVDESDAVETRDFVAICVHRECFSSILDDRK